MGTMSINILERTREIGVLRAIGAPGRSVSQVFILVIILSAFASYLPKRNATRLTVREILAYE